MHPTTNRPLTIALSLLLASAAASAQTLDTPEPGSIEAIAQETSDSGGVAIFIIIIFKVIDIYHYNRYIQLVPLSPV